MLRKSIVFTGLLSVFYSCVKEAEWYKTANPDKEIAVECLITDELRNHVITLTEPVNTVNEEYRGISGAEVIVTVDSNIYHFQEMSGNQGNYISDLPFEGKPGKEHSLLIDYDGKIYSAKTTMISWEGYFGSSSYSLAREGNLYKIVWQTSPYDPTYAVMFELLLDWSHVAGYETADSSDTHARMFSYTLPTLDVSEIFAPTAQIVKFPAGTLIVEHRYRLTPHYAAYIRALLLETSWQGGFFPSASANVPTNLSAGAVGFFGASSVISQIRVAGSVPQ
jgi:hypothetical protein